MKTRMIQPIGKKISVLLANNRTHRFNTLFPLDTKLTDEIVYASEDYKMMQQLSRKAWGLIVIYNTDSGKPEPGDMFWRESYKTEPHKNFYWDNAEENDLIVILPNGMEWNIDSRASNCTLPNDRTHRCWHRTGTPPNITVTRGGCPVGAGSIRSGNYHGFLRNGEFTNNIR